MMIVQFMLNLTLIGLCTDLDGVPTAFRNWMNVLLAIFILTPTAGIALFSAMQAVGPKSFGLIFLLDIF